MRFRTRGFSLIELMVSLVIAVFLATVAIPSFNTIIQDYRTTAATNDWVNAVRFARAEAVSRNTNITLCAGTNTAGCQAGATWSQGWSVVAGTNVIKLWGAPPAEVGFTESAGLNSFQFSGRGWLTANVQMTAKNNHCDSSDSDGERVVSVALSGRVSVTRNGC